MATSSGMSGAITGALATGIAISVPATVTMPWYGYIVLGVVNVLLGFGIVYASSKLMGSGSE